MLVEPATVLCDAEALFSQGSGRGLDMNGFGVDVDALRGAATAVAAAADGVRDIDVVDALRDSVTAMPAAVAPVACLGLARRFELAVNAYAARVEGMSAGVDRAASGFAAVDAVAAAHLVAMGRSW